VTSKLMEEGPRGLSDLPLRELRELRRALDEGRLQPPFHEFALTSAGIPQRRRAAVSQALSTLSQATAKLALDLVIAERAHRPPPHLELVWTGPEAKGTSARDTSIVVRQLFESATHSVIIGGFRFDQGEVLFRPLHEKMRQGLTTSIFVDIEGHVASAADVDAFATRYITEFVRRNWPFGMPYPAVYYDPQSVVVGPPWVSLHAKCVVIDDARAFITSANFTDRGQTRNLEAGVLIEDRSFAEKLAGQWRALISRGLVRKPSLSFMEAP
jgi:phosphatidylserine/phosphatidylglycerophosphate/cardiolipin synthase-like enzyme